MELIDLIAFKNLSEAQAVHLIARTLDFELASPNWTFREAIDVFGAVTFGSFPRDMKLKAQRAAQHFIKMGQTYFDLKESG